MRVGRTGAKRGQSPAWYVGASTEEEHEAFRQGLLEDKAPDRRWRHLMAFGFPTKAAAEAAIDELLPEVEAAISRLSAQESG